MNEKPIKGEYLEILLRSRQTIFSTKDISLLWGVSSADTVKSRLNYYVKKNDLYHIKSFLIHWPVHNSLYYHKLLFQ